MLFQILEKAIKCRKGRGCFTGIAVNAGLEMSYSAPPLGKESTKFKYELHSHFELFMKYVILSLQNEG